MPGDRGPDFTGNVQSIDRIDLISFARLAVQIARPPISFAQQLRRVFGDRRGGIDGPRSTVRGASYV